MKIKKSILLSLLSVFISTSVFSKNTEIDGKWQGSIKISGVNLKIIVEIDTDAKEKKYTIQIPQQLKEKLELSEFQKENKNIKFQLKTPNGTAFFDGEIDKDNILGKFSQNGGNGIFEISRNFKEEEKKVNPNYNEEEVSFKNNDVTLAGTFSTPKKGSNFPVVILITGSGPQNRDEEIFGMKPFELMANFFNKKGFAVLRFDDRGVGESTFGKNSDPTTLDLSTDTEAAIKYLKTRKDINKNKIGLFGHSEGGMIVNMIASKNPDVSFGIMMAGTSITGERILLEQAELIARADGIDEKIITKNRELSQKIYDIQKKGINKKNEFKKIKNLIKEAILSDKKNIPENLKNTPNELNDYVEKISDSIILSVNSKWMEFFISYDPKNDIEKVKVPVLAIFGSKDLQVPSESNKKSLEEIIKKTGQKNYDIVVIKDANHLFQEAKTGSPSEYGTLSKEFIPDFLKQIEIWLDKNIIL